MDNNKILLTSGADSKSKTLISRREVLMSEHAGLRPDEVKQLAKELLSIAKKIHITDQKPFAEQVKELTRVHPTLERNLRTIGYRRYDPVEFFMIDAHAFKLGGRHLKVGSNVDSPFAAIVNKSTD